MNAIFYWADNSCKWDALPHDLPPRSTVHGYFSKWVKKGVWQQLNDQLRKQVRVKAGREEDPSLSIIDSQSVKTAQKGALKRVSMAAATTHVAALARKLKADDTSW